MSNPINYLALGDSYTIGEGVTKRDSFPFQLVDRLRKQEITVRDPLVIAQTGWTTKDLLKALDEGELTSRNFDLVTLLIGVNNQYRGLEMQEYQEDLDDLMELCLRMVDRNADRVVVLSIPDYSLTPFGQGRNPGKISMEIEQYNLCNFTIAERHGATYVDIQESEKFLLDDPDLLVSDDLHPSKKMYRIWAEIIASAITAC